MDIVRPKQKTPSDTIRNIAYGLYAMFVVGAVVGWGFLIWAIVHYVRKFW